MLSRTAGAARLQAGGQHGQRRCQQLVPAGSAPHAGLLAMGSGKHLGAAWAAAGGDTPAAAAGVCPASAQAAVRGSAPLGKPPCLTGGCTLPAPALPAVLPSCEAGMPPLSPELRRREPPSRRRQQAPCRTAEYAKGCDRQGGVSETAFESAAAQTGSWLVSSSGSRAFLMFLRWPWRRLHAMSVSKH